MTALKRLSIICVTYKNVAGLQLTLGSLARLGKENLLEVILVDSSPELSASYLQEIQGQLPLHHIICPPEGIYQAMNAGLRQAQGDFLWFLNSGDYLLEEEVLRQALSTISADDSIAFISAGADLYRDGKFRYPVGAPESWAAILGVEKHLCHQAVIYRKSKMAGLFPFATTYALAADFDLHLRAWLAGAKYIPVKGAVVAYDTSGASANSDKVYAEMNAIALDRLANQPDTLIQVNNGIREQRRRMRWLAIARKIPGRPILDLVWTTWQRISK